MQSDYTKISQLLHDNQVENSLAEIHGLVTGLLCTGNPEADPEDVGQLLQPPQIFPDLTRKLMLQLATSSQEQLGSSEYNFQPLLPPDDSALPDRVVALAEWCDGFTVGFAAAYFLPESRLGAEVREILTDFSQFAAMADAVNDLSDQDEVDYMELVEYVRMATIMVYQQVADTDTDTASEKSGNDDIVPDAEFLH
jgi:uncharacterized protein YgfB (UPF0149 family)